MSIVSFSGGVNKAPHLIGPSFEESISKEVLRGDFGTVGIEAISYLLQGLGADKQGYLACYLCPYGSKKVKGDHKKVYTLYESTVPVWIVRSDGKPADDPSVCELKKYTTDRFVQWLRERHLSLQRKAVNSGAPEFQQRLNSVRGAPSVLPRDSISVVGIRPRSNVPAPSSVGSLSKSSSGKFVREVPPPSVVNSVTGDHTSYNDELNQAEAEFRDTPRIRDEQGNLAFDPTEYLSRLDRLDLVRAKFGLPGVPGNPTPSTYNR